MQAFPRARALHYRETIVQSADESGKASGWRLIRHLSNIDRRLEADDEMGMAGRQSCVDAWCQSPHAGAGIMRDETSQNWRRQTGLEVRVHFSVPLNR